MQASVTDTHGAKQRAEEAYSSSQAQLATLKRKAHAYKKENRTLLSNYDDWLKTLVAQRGGSGAHTLAHQGSLSD